MKRYRIISFSFDSTPCILSEEIRDEWEPKIKQQHIEALNKTISGIKEEYGNHLAEWKIINMKDLGPKPFSIISYHTLFLEQIRRSFICFGYYPALTGACALGERILNHLMLKLRNDYRDRPEYKKVCSKQSFDNWKLAIDTLEKWNILLPKVAAQFRDLYDMRNQAIHFRPELEKDSRTPALNAINLITEIILEQFSAIGNQPWFIPHGRGESYIKKEAEKWPFIREFYLPSCAYVSPYHKVEPITPDMKFNIIDNCPSDNTRLTDEEYLAAHQNYISLQFKRNK